jgi:hypothetical protein
MRKPIIKAWTSEDDALLTSLIAKGASAIRVAAALKRSKQGVYNRARRLGLLFHQSSIKGDAP